MRLQLILILLSLPFGLMAQQIASKVQTREWTEKHPPKGFTITNTDRYVDYLRDGRVVFRVIDRIVSLTNEQNKSVTKGPQYWVEFVADGNVFAVVALNEASTPNWTVLSSKSVYFTSGISHGLRGAPDRRFFHVCVPQDDYYEYLEINGAEVKPTPETPGSYAAGKQAFIKMTERGYLHKLGRERLLDSEKQQP